MEYYPAIKKNKIIPSAATYMDLEIIILSEVSQNEKYQYSILTHISEKAMVHHSSTLAWKIPWMKEPGRLRSMGSLRVRHD